jgi:hypothetical protein
MKSMFQMGFRHSFFEAPRMGAPIALKAAGVGKGRGGAAAFTAAVSTFAPSMNVFPIGWPYSYYYDPYPQAVYQIQAPVQPAAPVVTTGGIPTSAYYVGGAALLAGLIALLST